MTSLVDLAAVTSPFVTGLAVMLLAGLILRIGTMAERDDRRQERPDGPDVLVIWNADWTEL